MAQIGPPLFLSHESCDAFLEFRALDTGLAETMPIHAFVMGSQCTAWGDLIRASQPRMVFGKPWICFDCVPHMESFRILVEWLYSHDCMALALRLVALPRIEDLCGFLKNAVFLGVQSDRLVPLIQAMVGLGMDEHKASSNDRENPDNQDSHDEGQDAALAC